MNWLFRPSLLALVTGALAIGAAALVLWPRSAVNRALPLAVPEGDQEIVWLYAATNASAWQRLVTAVDRAAQRLDSDLPELGLEVDYGNAFPRHTTAIPEVVLSFRQAGCLRLRWYKLTSDLKTQDWVEALTHRQPPPLAILGGSSSDLAIDLAQALRHALPRLGEAAPLLLLTMATADEVLTENATRAPLNRIYPQRTFRFCFTNRQMAEAVTDFIWSQEDLRPDTDQVFLALWEDDPYSVDLTDRFCEALCLPAVRAATRDWAWMAGFSLVGGIPLDLHNLWREPYRRHSPPRPELIPYSVGSFSQPNRWEIEAARDLLAELESHPHYQRPLLILPATSQPARRFLRGLERAAPMEARRFVVATGDALAFNNFYRDRNLTWPIQDLPFPLVFFCHRNPVDPEAGFRPERRDVALTPNEGSPATGTEDVLLYVDLMEALAQAAGATGPAPPTGLRRSLATDPGVLANHFRRLRFNHQGRVRLAPKGALLFNDQGNRQSGTGEHIVCLRPFLQGDQVLPRATIAVWSWQRKGPAAGQWRLIREPLLVEYDEAAGE